MQEQNNAQLQELKKKNYQLIGKYSPNKQFSYKTKEGYWKHSRSYTEKSYKPDVISAEIRKEGKSNAIKGSILFLNIVNKILKTTPEGLKIVKINEFQACVKNVKGDIKLNSKQN